MFLGLMSRRRKWRPQPTTDQRSPDERLEAFAREPNPERAHRMIGRIYDDLDAKPDPGPWISAARTLSERLIISDSALYHLAEKFTECVIFAASTEDPELARLRSEMVAIERAHGLREDDFWTTEEATAEWRALNDAWDRRADAIVGACFQENGHADLAVLWEENRAEFDRRAEQGRIDLWGEDDEVED
jgi:hypothetical protein